MSRLFPILFLCACTPLSPADPSSSSSSETPSSSGPSSTGTSSEPVPTSSETSSSQDPSTSGEVPGSTQSSGGSTTDPGTTTSSTGSESSSGSEGSSTGDAALACDPPSSKCGTPEQECQGTPGCLPECVWDTRLIFISSKSFTGDLGGIQGANQTCQALALDQGFCGTFKALLQWELSTMWKDHKNFVGRYLQTNGEILSEGVLLEKVEHGPFYGENGNLQTGAVWSGFGNMDLGKTCQGPGNTPWTNEDPESFMGWAGVAGGFQTKWYNFDALPCSQTARLHCVQVD